MVILFRQLREISGPIAEEILVVHRYHVDTETTLKINHENKERAYEGHSGFMTYQAICGGVYLLLSTCAPKSDSYATGSLAISDILDLSFILSVDVKK